MENEFDKIETYSEERSFHDSPAVVKFSQSARSLQYQKNQSVKRREMFIDKYLHTVTSDCITILYQV